jgi:hypothetical protein
LRVVATKSQRVHIQAGDTSGEGQAPLKSINPKYIKRLSVRIPKERTFNNKLSSSFGDWERQI